MTAAVLLVTALLTGGSAYALAERDVAIGTFHHGPLEVSLTGDNGEAMRGPYFNVAGAMPRMPAKHAAVRIANTGNEAAHFRIAVTDLQAQGRRSLDEVLEVTVRRLPSGKVVYRGRLSTAAVASSAPLRPGESAIHDVAVAWPDTPADDNPYQNAALTFAVEVIAMQA